ncbi:hypothetical protein SAMN05660916_03018 [Arthrobacter sp. 31Cvi3.1E]|nr:hypothetical protein SAMN05660916_03018 [Arthrobacter sp. 31Cvi3.1E]
MSPANNLDDERRHHSLGAQNVSKAFTLWRSLTDQPFRALTYMALVSMDSDNPPTYWGGRDALAEALGHTLPAAESEDAEAAAQIREKAYRAVKRALKSLHQEGAIQTIKPASFRSHAVYGIMLRIGVDNCPQGTEKEPPKGTDETPPKGAEKEPPKGTDETPVGYRKVAQRVPLTGPHRSTRNKEEQYLGIQLGTKSPPSPNLTEAPSPDENDEKNRQLQALEELMSRTAHTP